MSIKNVLGEDAPLCLGYVGESGAMREEEMLALLATDDMPVKRPLPILESPVLVGFKEGDWAGNRIK